MTRRPIGLTVPYRKSTTSVSPTQPKVLKREWVSLTEQERNDIEDACEMMIGKPAFDAIEAKLKEKNT